jgi:hypothetical protein
MTHQGPFRTLKDVITFEKAFIQELVSTGVAWKHLHEGATILSSGIGHASFINDDAVSKELILYSKRKVERGDVLTHIYGASKQLNYQKKNRDIVTGEQEFTKQFGERYAFKMYSTGGQPLTQAQCEEIRVSLRGSQETREKILAQCGIIIEMIRAKISTSYWSKLESQSKTFKRGIINRCVLSVIEGMKEAVANPGGEDAVKAESNREVAEKLFLVAKFSKEQQLDPFQMEEHVDPFIQTIWRTKSTWTDTVIIRKLLGKLDNVSIYKDIAREWDTSQKYVGCDSLELFWRIIQLECEIHIDTSKVLESEEEVHAGGSSYMALSNPNVNSGIRKGECFEYYKTGNCRFGDICKHLHLAEVRSSTEDSKYKRKEMAKDVSKEGTKPIDEKQLRIAYTKMDEERKRQRSSGSKPSGSQQAYPKSGGQKQGGGARIFHAEVEETSEDDDAEEAEKDFQIFYSNFKENSN